MELKYDVVDTQPDNDFVLVVAFEGAKRVFAKIPIERLRDAVQTRDNIRGRRANTLVTANLPKVSALMTARYRAGQFAQTPTGTENYLIDITTADLEAMDLETSALTMEFGFADQAGRFGGPEKAS